MRWWMKTESAQVSGTKVRVRPATRSAVALEQESFNYCPKYLFTYLFYISFHLSVVLIESYVFETETKFPTSCLIIVRYIVGRVEPDFIPANYP